MRPILKKDSGSVGSRKDAVQHSKHLLVPERFFYWAPSCACVVFHVPGNNFLFMMRPGVRIMAEVVCIYPFTVEDSQYELAVGDCTGWNRVEYR